MMKRDMMTYVMEGAVEQKEASHGDRILQQESCRSLMANRISGTES
jgi:hypothetical protein